MALQRDERLFVVRMWLERSQARPNVWRGSIYDVHGSRTLFVTAPGEVADFISGRLSEADATEEVP